MTESLKSLQFSDLYLGTKTAMLAGVPGTLDPVPAPATHQAELDLIRKLCLSQYEAGGRRDFAIQHDGVRYRVALLESIVEVIFVLRRFPQTVPLLSTLGLHPSITEKLMARELTGLILVSGTFGQGKTTTASSIVVSRIAQYGGVAITIEDPAELPMEGKHGEGVCYQTEVGNGGFPEACKRSMRWAPTLVFLGEIRDNETADEAIGAAINGRTLVCTIHADSPSMAIERIFTLASGTSRASEDVAHLLATGLTAAIHQKLIKQGDKKQMVVESLWVEGEDAHGIRAMIVDRKFKQLGSAIQTQKNRALFNHVANKTAKV